VLCEVKKLRFLNNNLKIESFIKTISLEEITISNEEIDILKMVMLERSDENILRILLKNIAKKHTITSLSEEIGMGRPGIWKALKRLESKNLINLAPIGKGKTSAYEITLNWKNPLVEKTLATILTEDALKQEKWRYNFKELENQVDFLILFGSVLHSPKEANDIDILNLISNKKNFTKIDKIMRDIQITQNKKIHTIDITKKELKEELKEKNKAYLDAFKKGIVLFGQEDFTKFIKDLQ